MMLVVAPVLRVLANPHYTQFRPNAASRCLFVKETSANFFIAAGSSTVNGLIDQADTAGTLQRVELEGRQVIIKSQLLTNWSKRVRATFGVQRHGAYDWAIAEIHSSLHAQTWGLVPELHAYGWEQGRSGMIKRAFVIMEDLKPAINVLEFVERYPERRETALELAFQTLLVALRRGLIHLDPWPGNFLVNQNLTKCWLIDLECSKLGSSASLERQLGFSLGFFYRGKFSACMTWALYLSYLQQWLNQHLPELDHQTILEMAADHSQGRFSRKHRVALL